MQRLERRDELQSVEVKAPETRVGARISNIDGMPQKIERLLTEYSALSKEQRVHAENALRKIGTKGLRERTFANADTSRMVRFGPEVMLATPALAPILGFLLAALAVIAVITLGSILLLLYKIYAAAVWTWVLLVNGTNWAVTTVPYAFVGAAAGVVAAQTGIMAGLTLADGVMTGGIGGIAVGTAFHFLQNVDWDYQKWWWANIIRQNKELYQGGKSLLGWIYRGIRSTDPEYKRIREEKDQEAAAKAAAIEAAKTPDQKLKEQKQKEAEEKKREEWEMKYGHNAMSTNGRLWISFLHGITFNVTEVFFSDYGTAIVGPTEAVGRTAGIAAIAMLIGYLTNPAIGLTVAAVGVLMTLIGHLKARWLRGPHPNVATREGL